MYSWIHMYILMKKQHVCGIVWSVPYQFRHPIRQQNLISMTYILIYQYIYMYHNVCYDTCDRLPVAALSPLGSRCRRQVAFLWRHQTNCSNFIDPRHNFRFSHNIVHPFGDTIWCSSGQPCSRIHYCCQAWVNTGWTGGHTVLWWWGKLTKIHLFLFIN